MTRALLLLCLLLAAPVRAEDARWDRYQLLMWQDRTPAQLQGLAALGFTGVKVRASLGQVDRPGRDQALAAGLTYYLENIATDFYAPYHRYAPGKPVTWLFDAAKQRRRDAPDDPSVFLREPGLSDPAFLARVRDRLAAVVRAEAPHGPLFYNLGDETGIGDLAAAWDADLAPASLAAMRDWLRTQYPSLAALNRQWNADFPSWDAVQPELTDAALRRTDGNYSAWSDFKAWMDVAFARAVRAGTDAVHAADPGALAAIEGAQVPGWGGYDYARLAPAVDVMEIYDYGHALDLATAFNPDLIPIRTSFGRGPREAHAAWRSVLHGGRGMIVWDEDDDVVRPDGAPGPRGREIAALAAAIAPVMPALATARPAPDPVAVLHSQASFRLRWLLDRRAGDHDWSARDAEREYDDNAWRASRRILLRRLAEIGVQPRFVAADTLGPATLAGVKVLLLPHAIALSDADVSAIQAFRAGGGAVLADTEPGLYDGHGRRRAAPPLPGVPHPQPVRPDNEDTPATLAKLAALLAEAGARPRATVLGPDGQPAPGVEARWWRDAAGTILALQSGRPWGAPPRITLALPAPAAVTDLRRPGPPAVATRLDLSLDPIEPTILRLSPP